MKNFTENHSEATRHNASLATHHGRYVDVS